MSSATKRIICPNDSNSWVGYSGIVWWWLVTHCEISTEPGSPANPAATADVASRRATVLPLQKPDGSPMTVVVTGSVPGLTRDEGNEAVETLGGKSSGSVSARTDLVVVGDGAGSKAAKAEQLGIRILPAAEFAALLTAYTASDTQTTLQIPD